MSPTADYPPIVTARDRFVFALRCTVGLPYGWGKDGPPDGAADCSGDIGWGIKCTGLEPWASNYPARFRPTAASMWVDFDPLPRGTTPLPGDLAFYGVIDGAVLTHGHVVAVTGVDEIGVPTELIGASQGLGRVKVYTRHDYRGDFVGFRRFPGHMETPS